jgi:hypothetical protein
MNDYKVVTDSGTFNVSAFSHADAIAGLNLGPTMDEVVDGKEVFFRFADGSEISVLEIAQALAWAA